MGLLDWMQTPGGMGLLAAAAGTMAGARRGQPWNTAGRGALAGLAGYASANDQIRQDQEAAFQRQYREMQMADIQRKMEQDRAMREASKAAAAKAMPMENVYVPTGNQSPLMPNLGGGTDGIGDYSMMGNAAPVSFTNEVQQRRGQFDPNAYSSAMMAELAQRGFADEAVKYAPKQKDPFTVGDALIDPVTFKPLYQAPQAIDYNKPFLPDGSPNLEYQRFATNKARAGAPKVVNNISQSTEKKYGEQFAGKVAESDVSLMDTAQKAPELAARAGRIKQVLRSGKVITGYGADYRLAFAKAAGLVGASDSETIANTEALAADLSKNTLDAIKASGLGSGSGFSNADRDFLEKAAGGKIAFDAKTLDRLADLAYRTATLSADRWNKRAKTIPESAIHGTGLSTDPISIPEIADPGNQSGGVKFLGFE